MYSKYFSLRYFEYIVNSVFFCRVLCINSLKGELLIKLILDVDINMDVVFGINIDCYDFLIEINYLGIKRGIKVKSII